MDQGITFQQEKVRECYDEALPLLAKQWAETGPYDDIPLDPDSAVYLTAEAIGLVRCYTIRDQGVLQGYAVFFVRKSHQYRSLQATQDILYVSPALRSGVFGMQFIEWCDQQLKIEGVQVVRQFVTAKRDFGPVLKRMGYDFIGSVWTRRLDREG